MATVTNIADRVCRLTGLQSTGSERTLVLEYLNDAYREAVERSECYPKTSSSVSVSADATSTTISGTVTDLGKVHSVYLSGYDGYSYLKLQPVSMRQRLELLHAESSSSGIPRFYAIRYSGGTVTLHLYPLPESAATVVLEYNATPLTLVESAPGAGQESTPTAIPSVFHYRTIAAGAIAMALETDQRRDSQPWWDRFERGVMDLTMWVNEFQGDHLVESHFLPSGKLGGSDRSRDLF